MLDSCAAEPDTTHKDEGSPESAVASFSFAGAL
jgi:hypothetical protein